MFVVIWYHLPVFEEEGKDAEFAGVVYLVR